MGNTGFIKFILVQLLILPPYYFCEEFFFRGFMFMGLWKKINWHSFWVTDIIFFYSHLGKPPLELIFALPVGIVLNYITLRTKSVYPAIIVHCIAGIFLNSLVYLAHLS